MTNGRNKRWRLFADLPIQGGLLIRVVGYWVMFQIAHVATIALFDFLSSGKSQTQGIGSFLAPAMIVSLLFVPIAMVEITAFSNRFVGPMVGLRRKMKALANGEEVNELHFRAGDFYQDLPPAFNDLLRRLDATGESDTTDVVDDAAERMECHV